VKADESSADAGEKRDAPAADRARRTARELRKRARQQADDDDREKLWSGRRRNSMGPRLRLG
jgi:hypothetical protein